MAKKKFINSDTGQTVDPDVLSAEPPKPPPTSEEPFFEILADVRWRAGEIKRHTPELEPEEAERQAIREYMDRMRDQADAMVARYRETTVELVEKLLARIRQLEETTDRPQNPIAAELAGIRASDADAEKAATAVREIAARMTPEPAKPDASASRFEAMRYVEGHVEGVPEKYRIRRKLSEWVSDARKHPGEDLPEDVFDQTVAKVKKLFPSLIKGRVVLPNGHSLNKLQYFQFLVGDTQTLREAANASRSEAEKENLNLQIRIKEEEIKKYMLEITVELHRKVMVAFLDQPLGDIYDQLRRGERHPRMYQKGEKASGGAEAVVAKNLKDDVRPVYLDLVAGLHDALNEFRDSDTLKREARRAAYQIENGFFKEAAQTVHALTGAVISNPALHERLSDYRDAIDRQAIDAVAETETWSASLYRILDDAIPKWITRVERELAEPGLTRERREELMNERKELKNRTERLRKRRATEMTLGRGKIVKWEAAGKAVERGGNAMRYDLLAEHGQEGKINGKEKVFIVMIDRLDADGHPVVDADGHPVVDANGYPLVDADGNARLAADGEPGVIYAFVKTPLNETYFRQFIPPTSVAVNEWLAGFEAVAFGADEVFPATALRETAFGQASFQEYVHGKDENGKTHEGTDVRELEDADGNVDLHWADRVLRLDKEMIAVLHAMQRAADGGVPNFMLTLFNADFLRAHSVDNSLINPSNVTEFYISHLAAERAANRRDEPLSPAVLSLVRRYADVVDHVVAAIEDTLPYETRSIIQHRRRIIQEVLRTGMCPVYDGVQDEKYMRDGGICEKEFAPRFAAQAK